MDLRDEYIARVVPGRSFADVGGLWGVVNEKVSVALRAGAGRATMIDVTAEGRDLWRQFRQRLDELGVGHCECFSSDVCAFAARNPGRRFDVVHCSGVLYHHPNPIALIEALRDVTARHLVLTSAITQETVCNELGTVRVPPGGVIFVPGLDPHERDVLWKYWREEAGVGACWGISEPVKWNPRDFGPWWWLPTARAMLAMAESAGFRVIEHGMTWNGNACTALLELM
jgi:hypothetical protein